jgi:pilus assembly protein CpaC
VVPALRTRRAHTGVELRDGQSFALAGLLDNNETRSFSKIPVLGDIPILGNLFKSSSFQKQESELMFIITADLVKPVNRDDLPTLRGVDGLKNGSPLGVEPQGEGITGKRGFSTGAATPTKTDASSAEKTTPATENKEAPKTIAPPAANSGVEKGAESNGKQNSEKTVKATVQAVVPSATATKATTPK